MSQKHQEYFDALRRLQSRGAKINQNTVALEAGRSKGSIKPSRDSFKTLIAAIEEASKGNKKELTLQDKLDRCVEKLVAMKASRDAGLAREINLIRQVFEQEKELVALRGGRVVPIRRAKEA